MATHRISGVWKNSSKVITHYAVHTIGKNYVERALKLTKSQAIALVETQGNAVTTWLWNYSAAKWRVGESVHVVSGPHGKYLRSNHDGQLVDNLDHLIDFDWLQA